MFKISAGLHAAPTSPEAVKAMKQELDEKMAPIAPLLVIIIGAVFCGLTGLSFLGGALRDMTSEVYSTADAPANMAGAAVSFALIVILVALLVAYKRVKLNRRIWRQIRRHTSVLGRHSR